MKNLFAGKKLLITGGTGSFGRALLDNVLDTNLEEIRIFSRDEKKQEDLRLSLRKDNLRFFIGDVRDYSSVDDAMVGVDFVFHAAALKQVPSCEFYPLEAVRTNVLGAENVMRAARKQGVSRVVVLSTDKAVYPINAMGMSKAMMEKVMVANSRMMGENGTIFCATRYGNVMGSRGSVIPLFVDQLKMGHAITITDPKMTRFLMSLQESVALVLHAFENARSGEIYVQKSPAATVGDLADAIGNILGMIPKVSYIGTRHGEKLFETLVSREEMARTVDQGQYYQILPDARDLNYDIFFEQGDQAIESLEDYTSHNTLRLSGDELVTSLQNAGLDRLFETSCQ